ncbi:hypothetical protein [Caballeronia sordidicola]|uniref:Uncharacterized protein n=1 Tax=Caballeronia sordidicola TaxID=196367 RepID=A0A226X5D7_CABSO|nr:hypothetical protein [Caballeronia sordidicola]OXC78651.1 hypothetical protein BSU04_11005 [Caballeronia sordidicola]
MTSLISLPPPLPKPSLGGYMTVEHDGTAAFNRGIFENYETALSIAYAVEESGEFAKVKPSTARKVEVFPISTALYIALISSDHPMKRRFDLEEAVRNTIWVLDGFRAWGTPQEARFFPAGLQAREAEKPEKTTVQGKAAKLGVTVSAVFYHKKPVGTPLTDQEMLVLDHDWAAYQAKSSARSKRCETKEAYLLWRQQCAARDRAKAGSLSGSEQLHSYRLAPSEDGGDHKMPQRALVATDVPTERLEAGGIKNKGKERVGYS